MTHRSYAPAAALLVTIAVAVPARADHSWNSYHWARTTTSFDLPVVDSVTSEWQFAFDESLRLWGQSSKLNNVVAGVAEDSRTRKRCSSVSGQMRVCNAAYGQNGWLGLAVIYLDSNGHITRGVAKLNDSYDWYFAQVPGEDNHVMCQEIAHVYGLDHTSEDGSSQGTCMDYSSSLASQWPNAHDYEQLAIIYGHTDSYDTYDSGAGGGGGCTAPPGKGCNKHDAPDGVPQGAVRVHYEPGRNGKLGHAHYVLPDRKGGLWIFHLTLIPEDVRPRE